MKHRADVISALEIENALEKWARQGVGLLTHQESIGSYRRYNKSITEHDKQVFAWDKNRLTVFTPRHEIKPAIRSWWVWVLGWIGAFIALFLGLPLLSMMLEKTPFNEADDFLFPLWGLIIILILPAFIVITSLYKYFGGPTHRNALKVDEYEFDHHVRVAVQLMDEEDILLFTQAVMASNENPAANDVAVTLVGKHSPRIQAQAERRRNQNAADAKAAAQRLQAVAEEVERKEIKTEVEKELERRRWQAIKDGLK